MIDVGEIDITGHGGMLAKLFLTGSDRAPIIRGSQEETGVTKMRMQGDRLRGDCRPGEA
jgi:hypothetical protein